MEFLKCYCPKCNMNPAYSKSFRRDDKGKPKCDDCGTALEIAEETDPDMIIEMADRHLEGANKSISAYECWSRINKFIQKDQMLDAAKALANFFENL